MDLINPDIENYCINLSFQPSADCREIYDYTTKHFDDSQMLVGPLEAGFLGLLAKTIKARRILEIGCYTGYSALAMAEQLPMEGLVVTIDTDREKGQLARNFWDRSGHGHKITFYPGPALDLLNSIQGPFDLVFIDADKQNYIPYLEMTLPLLSERGIIAADNTLWYGTVIDPGTEDFEGRAIQEFNEYVQAREDLIATIIPMRDGLSIIKKA